VLVITITCRRGADVETVERVIVVVMQGFYSKVEASNILGVSTRQVNVYLQKGKLRKVYHGKRVWIPHEDVHALYDDTKKGMVPRREELSAVEKRVEHLESTIEVLKLGMGFGAKRDPRTGPELLLIRQGFLDSLSKAGWKVREISEIADLLMSLREEEILLLISTKGISAWSPLLDLSNRMISFVESSESFPAQGLGTLHSRLIRAKDRFLGLVYTSSKTNTRLPKNQAAKLYKKLEETPGIITDYVTQYISSKLELSKGK